LPEALGNLSELTGLNFYRNAIEGLPESIGNLKQLTYLNIYSNSLTSLPEGIGGLESLERLDVYGNELSALPESFGNLSSLADLDAHDNQLSALPASFGNLGALSDLDLNGNAFSGEMPPVLCGLSSLATLDLSNNELTSVPSAVGQLSQLRSLNLYYNQLSGDLPSGLSSLPLTSFYIRNNYLTFRNIAASGVPGGQEGFYYSPQRSVPLMEEVRQNLDVTLSIPDHMEGDVYQWYQSNSTSSYYSTLLYEGPSNSYTLSPDKTYHYYCKITNTGYPDLTLTSEVKEIVTPYSDLDRAALVSIYEACGGSGWNNNTNWCSEADIGDWDGVSTTRGRVTSISLNNNQLTGTLPDSIGLLSELTSINLRNNNLTGDLPTSLNDLNKLTSLYIDNNQYDFGNLIASGLMPDSISTYDYTPQQQIDAPEQTVVYPDIVLSIPYLKGNNYNWYAGGTLIEGADSCVYSFTPLSSSNYYAVVTNDLFPGLSLQTKPIAIDAIETLEIAGLTTTDVLCNGGHNGKVTFNITGGVIDGYTYSLDKTNWVVANESEIVIDTLSAKEYTLWVDDGYSSDSVNFIIEAPDALVIDTINLRPLSYLGASDGQITITAINGGADGDKQLNLDGVNTYTFTDNSLTVSELPVGTHNLLATDASGCSSDTLWFTITQPQTFTFDASIAQHETTADACDGVIVIDSIYASQTLSFEYTKDNRATWDAIEQGDSITGLTAGDYTIILRADGVESEPEAFTIKQTCSSYTASINDLTGCGDTIGSFNASGLTPDKEYQYLLIPKGQAGKPTITLLGDNPLTWSLGETFVDPGATAYDEKDGDITDDIITSNNIDINTEGTYQVTYNVTDSDGNAAEEVVREVVVEENSFNPEEVTIGTQTWMAVNLDIDDGLGGIYAYGDVATYGRLYTWEAALRVAAIIDGWHLPSDAEWTTLANYLGGNSVAGGKLKEAGTTHWISPNEGATNETGFTALPGSGYSSYDDSFHDVGYSGAWWSSSENGEYYAYTWRLNYRIKDLFRYDYSKEDGRSVRLIKDYSHTPTITLLGDSSVSITVGDTYTDAGATASDTRYGDITDDIVVVNNVNTAIAGTYTVTYTVTTEDGYSAEEVVREVVVEESLFEEVTIGTQTWMAKNLDIDDGQYGVRVYHDRESNASIYGRLYTLSAATRIANSIDGWHIPNETEWNTLIDYIGGRDMAAGKLKETGTSHWNSPNEGATDEYGFTALPAGSYNYPLYSGFQDLHNKAWFVCYSSVYTSCGVSLWYNDPSYHTLTSSSYQYFFSVRLIKD
jgi:uncharacterized protein (TIGR02145 family)